ncbi:MAG TPA: hypothetical protein VMV92_36425 [Streptosporangiaceae bacterium]|nr:hypothetical protein [Streptosporangiaceae bacterium]
MPRSEPDAVPARVTRLTPGRPQDLDLGAFRGFRSWSPDAMRRTGRPEIPRRSPARAAGKQPHDLFSHAGLERHILASPPLPVPFPAAQPGFLVGEALLLRLSECRFLGEDALPLIAFPGPAPAHHHSRQAARLPGAAGQCGVTCRDEDQVIHVGAGQAERTRLVHAEEIAAAAAASTRDSVAWGRLQPAAVSGVAEVMPSWG